MNDRHIILSRKQKKCGGKDIDPKEALKYPFSYLDIYKMNSYETIICDPNPPNMKNIKAKNFDKNIEKYLWVHEGQKNYEEDWNALVTLKEPKGAYAFYLAGCDYTGFDCRGTMKTYVSSKLSILIKFGMDNTAFETYMNETKETDEVIEFKKIYKISFWLHRCNLPIYLILCILHNVSNNISMDILNKIIKFTSNKKEGRKRRERKKDRIEINKIEDIINFINEIFSI